jgi:Family of unknown function (DUF6221)
VTDPNQTLTGFLLARLAEDQAQAERFPNWPIQRVLDDIAAKRRIVEESRDYSPELSSGDNGEWAFDIVLRLLASVYADHPDYRQEWAVEPPATSTDTRHVLWNGRKVGEADPSDSNTI